MNDYSKLIDLLTELTDRIRDLTETHRAMAKAVKNDDLKALSECLKQQQALTLRLRSMEQRRIEVQKTLQIEMVKLADLSAHMPDAKTRDTIRVVADRLAQEYRVMQSAAEVARSSVECSLHEVEKMLSGLGIDPAQTESAVLTDGKLHADFRA